MSQAPQPSIRLRTIFGNTEIDNCSECTVNIRLRYHRSVVSKFKGILDSLGVGIIFLFVYLCMYTHMHTYMHPYYTHKKITLCTL